MRLARVITLALSPPQRSLCVTRRLGRGKRERKVDDGVGKKKERDLCQVMCGSVAGFAVLW